MANDRRLRDHICDRADQFRPLLAASLAAFLLMVIWYPFTDPQTGTYVVVVLNLIAAGSFIVFSLVVFWVCSNTTIG